MSREHNISNNFDQGFICRVCGCAVSPLVSGGEQRNHCPHCLHSLHVDLKSGDRHCACRGIMEPIGIWVKKKGEWAILHRCVRCGFIRSNRIAGDDSEQTLFVLAAKAITQMPFPVEPVLKKAAGAEWDLQQKKGKSDD